MFLTQFNGESYSQTSLNYLTQFQEKKASLLFESLQRFLLVLIYKINEEGEVVASLLHHPLSAVIL